MAFSQLHTTMANLRMSLAEINDKEQQLDSMISQFRTQMKRLPRQVIYGRTGLDASLAAMGEIEERLADAVANRQRLMAFKKSATQELEALELVKRVDETRRSLQELKQGIRESGEDEESLAEIRRLEQFIAEHSKRAEWAITANQQDQQALHEL